MNTSDRRPIQSRNASWAQAGASFLISKKVHPNHISIASIAFALLAFVSLLLPAPFLLVALFIFLRLLCNLWDGMCALGAQIKNPLGALFNEVPDRITDTLFLILVGILSDALTLSLFASLAAAFTAYVRTLGASLGAGHDFGGPQSKSQRMGLLIGASFLTQGELWLFGSDYTMHAALWIIALGSLLTCWMRLTRLARTLKEQA